jgi:hypothetical protein
MRGWRGPRVWRVKRAEWSGGVGRRRSLLAAKPPAVDYQGPVIFKTTTPTKLARLTAVLPCRYPPSVLDWTSPDSTKPYSSPYPLCFSLGRSPHFRLHFKSARPRISVFPLLLTLHSPPRTHPVLVLPLFPETSPRPRHLSFDHLLGAICPTPLPSGWGRGVGQMARRTSGSPRFLDGGAGARISRDYAICPAPDPATGPVPNPAPLAGHPRGQVSPRALPKTACWSARTNSHFFERGVSHTSASRPRLGGRRSLFRELVRADQLTLF